MKTYKRDTESSSWSTDINEGKLLLDACQLFIIFGCSRWPPVTTKGNELFCTNSGLILLLSYINTHSDELNAKMNARAREDFFLNSGRNTALVPPGTHWSVKKCKDFARFEGFRFLCEKPILELLIADFLVLCFGYQPSLKTEANRWDRWDRKSVSSLLLTAYDSWCTEKLPLAETVLEFYLPLFFLLPTKLGLITAGYILTLEVMPRPRQTCYD